MRRPPARLLVIACVALGACSDDDGGQSATTGGTTATTVTASTASPTTAAAPPTPPTSSGATTIVAPATSAAPATTGATVAPTTAAVPTTTAREQVLGDPAVTPTHLGETRSGLLDVTAAPAGGLYQVFQDGVIRLTTAEGEDVAVALDISDLTEGGGERGLLGLAVHPDGQRAYVNYTDNGGDTVVAEYALAGDGTFVAESARALLEIGQPYPNHNGGGVAVGPDGYLYIGTGDGGSGGDPDRRSLDRGDLLGKMLRIDPAPSGDLGYTVPADNPFVDDPAARPEIWSVGLRNPWRFGFDAATGDLWIADVGQGSIEEIDVARAEGGQGAGRGLSFGWSAFEGDERYNDDQPADGHEAPIYTYDHGEGRCSVSGAAPYRGERITGLAGGFVFGDYCSGELWALAMDGSGRVVDLGVVGGLSAVRAIGEEVYALSLGDGLYRLDPA